jgi:hypothetical protein
VRTREAELLALKKRMAARRREAVEMALKHSETVGDREEDENESTSWG